MVPLVHSMWSDSATKCLIVKDLDKKHEDTVDMTEELLKEHQVTGITKVLPLDQLKKEHKGKSFITKFYFRWFENRDKESGMDSYDFQPSKLNTL